jgi:hypothetical protein
LTLALGAGAVFCDRVILGPAGGPASASAADLLLVPPSQATVPVQQQGQNASAATPLVDVITVSQRLEMVKASLPGRHHTVVAPGQEHHDDEARCGIDAFAIPASWRKSEPSPVKNISAGPTAVEAFQASAKLQSVVSGADSLVIMAGGKTLRLGDRMDGFTLVEIDAKTRSATFEGNGDRVTLVVPTLSE